MIFVDTLSFHDLKDFTKKYEHDEALVYFRCDGHTLSVRDLIALCKPYGKTKLYADHFNLNELINN